MSETAPSVWALSSYRAGETTQIQALARRAHEAFAQLNSPRDSPM